MPAPEGTGTPSTQQPFSALASLGDLTVPALDPEVDTLAAALNYAAAGWYVLPVRRGSKKPGSVVGERWQHQSSRDPQQIVAWFAATNHGIALHCGRSGAVVFDVDKPAAVPDALRRYLAAAPCQSSRPTTPGRAHYVFRQPPGRTIGNGTGRLGGAWGEVRGLNGVIVVAPSVHEDTDNAENPGEYRWERTGAVPALPDELAEMLDDASPASDAATDAQVLAFLAQHTAASRPSLINGWISALTNRFETGSRHDAAVSVTVGALKEAAAGYLNARTVLDTLGPMFVTAATRAPTGGERQRTEHAAAEEYRAIVAWAVGQARAADPEATRARTEAKMFDNQAWFNDIASTNGQAGDGGGGGGGLEDPDDSGQTVSQGISPAMGRRVELTTFADIRDDTPEWVWSYDGRGRIQRGTFTLFGGRPGAGKSTAARWFVAGFSTGTLDGCFLGRPQNVAYIAAEESGRYVVKPSLRAAGADLNRIYFPTVTSDGRATRLQSVADENELTELLIANNITVVVVDPVMSTIGGGVDIHRNNETRQDAGTSAEVARFVLGGRSDRTVDDLLREAVTVNSVVDDATRGHDIAASRFTQVRDADHDAVNPLGDPRPRFDVLPVAGRSVHYGNPR